MDSSENWLWLNTATSSVGGLPSGHGSPSLVFLRFSHHDSGRVVLDPFPQMLGTRNFGLLPRIGCHNQGYMACLSTLGSRKGISSRYGRYPPSIVTLN
eukprot:IDg23865t1